MPVYGQGDRLELMALVRVLSVAEMSRESAGHANDVNPMLDYGNVLSD